MMITKRRYLAIAAAALFVAGGAAMPADANPSQWKKSPYSVQGNFAPTVNNVPRWAQRKISASEAKSIAKRRAGGGEVVDISRNGNTYRVRVIRKDGRVVDVLIDATTGRVK
jgi:uncharacterized membrane protein YkoI